MKYLFAIALLALPSIAWADNHENGSGGTWYVAGSVGAVQPQTSDINGSATVAGFPISGNADVKYDLGGIACVAGGYDLYDDRGWPVRIEAEGCARRITFDQIDIRDVSAFGGPSFGLPTFDMRGNGEVGSGMANVWLDWRNESRVTPFVGAGFGYGRINIDVDCISSVCLNTDDTDGGLAGQLGIGMNVAVTDSIDFNLTYRHFRMLDTPKFQFDGAVGAVPFSADVESEYADNSVTFGIRYRF